MADTSLTLPSSFLTTPPDYSALGLKLIDNGDGTYSIATSGMAGTLSGAVKDAGPAWTQSYTHTASADMTTTANLTAAPASGQKIVVDDIFLSVDTDMNFIFEEETSGTDVLKVFIAANTTLQLTPRGKIKLATADKKLNGKASVAGNVAVTVVYHSEA